jgi:hypothetical protein
MKKYINKKKQTPLPSSFHKSDEGGKNINLHHPLPLQ